ncbi:mannose-1-phosphate guanylyltransferase/mannose-6-phosphate isomerase [Nitrococcus mobilis]|uniref:mannose-1-phosphate guanylyltransferase n=1 Tax=Nitrococcus mobilis Nb-231 TaxID=314278 RepID=A4BQ76_9GAMM|nr:mannose-1-phosphate guanylyltransferase/mannose-6-phosphate isomerase [Nitrococcus mobilis]EAR22231.1 mannose-1-phosphate guanylyltransferase-like protein [Nitrococcus mobilis Nb-231]
MVNMESVTESQAACVVPVILSGGVGSRLWPLSRELYPKQFIDLTACGRTLLQATVERLVGGEFTAPIIVCNHEHRFLLAEQLRANALDVLDILLEPVGRNTAPAVAVAALRAIQRNPQAVLVVLPADHVIRDTQAFREVLALGVASAANNYLVTFGIRPTAAETGFGYIQAGEPLSENNKARRVCRFVEKPEQDTAQSYLAAGNYFWNSGMFVFRAAQYLEELARFAPDIFEACEAALESANEDLDFLRLGAEAFERCRADSIDYAVMEHTADAVVIPFAGGWSDLGSWGALLAETECDQAGNAAIGDVMLHDSQNCYVRADGRLVALVGVHDHIVVETSDAVLVAARGAVQSVKGLVEILRRRQRPELTSHRRVHRPWGSYEGIASSERFQVKRIIVNPGKSLSLQMHHHRAEHWVIVRGTGRVIRGEESYLISEDQSTYIPLGTVHRLENSGVIPLELVEVQTGSYLGEDDIVRYEDKYGRC